MVPCGTKRWMHGQKSNAITSACRFNHVAQYARLMYPRNFEPTSLITLLLSMFCDERIGAGVNPSGSFGIVYGKKLRSLPVQTSMVVAFFPHPRYAAPIDTPSKRQFINKLEEVVFWRCFIIYYYLFFLFFFCYCLAVVYNNNDTVCNNNSKRCC